MTNTNNTKNISKDLKDRIETLFTMTPPDYHRIETVPIYIKKIDNLDNKKNKKIFKSNSVPTEFYLHNKYFSPISLKDRIQKL